MVEGVRSTGFRWGQIGTATLVSLAHGTNDAQKTMGVLTLALVANKSISPTASTPNWVIISCALAISLGTYLGGWRIIRTLGKGLIEIESPQGFAAEATSAVVILSSTHFGIPLSTTQVCSRLGRRRRARPGATSPVGGLRAHGGHLGGFTLPAAAAVGGLSFAIVNGIQGGDLGVIVMTVALAAAFTAGYLLYLLSRRTAVNAAQCQRCLGREGGASRTEPAPGRMRRKNR